MKQQLRFKNLFAPLLGLLFVAMPALAQNRGGGGFGGFGGFGGQQSSSSGANQRQYYNNTAVGDATISSDPESRRLIIITDEETSQYIAQVITNLDRPKPQVLIKVVFLEVTHNNARDLGIEGAWRRNIGNSMSGAAANVFGLSGLNSAPSNTIVNAFGQPVQSFVPTPPGAGLYQILSSDYQVTLRAIAQAGKTEVLSRPSILARNNQPASITIGQSVPLVTNVRYDNFGNAINSVQYTDVGIILRVTPFITSDGLVEMIIAPEISALTDQTVPIATGVSVPVISKRAADTVVVTPDGQTVIIGGLMENDKASTDSKIPFLGDIPLLGNLFKRKQTSGVKTELLIFLTPHIVSAPSQVAMVTGQQHPVEMIPKAFSEKDLDQFLDTLPTKESGTKRPSFNFEEVDPGYLHK